MAALSVVAVGLFGERIVDRGRAQTAADAAALAATTGGMSAAARLAGSNGGRLVSFTENGDFVVVVVEVGGERAVARATDGP
jgi:nitrous oxide reductase accessory protein NosL